MTLAAELLRRLLELVRTFLDGLLAFGEFLTHPGDDSPHRWPY